MPSTRTPPRTPDPDHHWGDATAILAAVGVPEDRRYHRRFDRPWQRAALTVAQRIQHAWRHNDADAFADVFAVEGSLALGENELFGRESIRAFMAHGFAGPLAGARVAGGPLTCDLVAPHVVVAVTEGGIVLPGEHRVDPLRWIRATWVVRCADLGRPELLSHHSCPSTEAHARREVLA